MSIIVTAGLMTFFLLHYQKEASDDNVINRFKKIYYSHELYFNSYLGIPSLQYPADNWVIQEIISEVKPDYIIETGTFTGGTTLFYADILEKVNKNGKVISIDLRNLAKEPLKYDNWKDRVVFYQADSTAEGLVNMIAERVKGKKVLVTLDSDHSKNHVLKELKLYSPLVSINSYIVVQDTHLGGHPNHHHSVPGEGPWEAVEEFMSKAGNFVIDHSREKHIITQNPSGFLKRVR